jgi:L,D-transpeptidase ErfK/SrfK
MKYCYAVGFAVAFFVLGLILTRYPDRRPDAARKTKTGVAYEGGTFQLRVSQDSLGRSGEQKRQFRLQPGKPYIVIDRYCNRIYLRTTDSIMLEAMCSTGSGGILVDSATGRRWKFDTPGGVFTVDSKLENPWWRKPDWAYIEEDKPIPRNEDDRMDSEMMGNYAIGFGNGYFIHGTIYERLVGVAVTHGCVRMSAGDLRKLYDKVEIGTRVYIF